MYIAIIIFVVILLLAIVVMINFADSDVPKLARLIVSSLILIILAAGVYYIAAPGSIFKSTSTETVPAEIPDTPKELPTVISKDTLKAKPLKGAARKDTVVSLAIKPIETKRTEAATPTVTSTVTPIPSDTLSTLLGTAETLTPQKQTINVCTSWIVMSSKPAKVTYRACCTNIDTTIEVTGSLGICAVYGFTPTGPGVMVLSNSICKCK
jgi:hypothetical protein